MVSDPSQCLLETKTFSAFKQLQVLQFEAPSVKLKKRNSAQGHVSTQRRQKTSEHVTVQTSVT